MAGEIVRGGTGAGWRWGYGGEGGTRQENVADLEGE